MSRADKKKGFYKFRRFEEPENIFLEDLRGEVWQWTRSWKDLAEIAGVGARTVGKFANGDTLQPRFTTIFKLMTALGLTLRKSGDLRRRRHEPRG